MPDYIKTFVFALVMALVTTPLVRIIAWYTGAVDKPGVRSTRGVHTRPIPRLGGLAIFIAFVSAVLPRLGIASRQMAGLLAGALVILIVGIVDDYRPLTARVKFLGQIIAAVIFVAAGNYTDVLTNPFGGMFFLGWTAYPLTVLWILTLVNGVNFIDGLDGLAAGVSSIAAFVLLMVALRAHQGAVVIMTAALAGAACGFLPYNFNPARIFMGDSGSMFIGYTLAAVAVMGTLKSAAAVGFLIPFLALGLPIFDSMFAILRRLATGKPVYRDDRDHLHHRLLGLGLNQRQAVVLMYLVSGFLGMSALALDDMRTWPGLLVGAAVLSAILLAAVRAGILSVRNGSVKNGRGA